MPLGIGIGLSPLVRHGSQLKLKSTTLAKFLYLWEGKFDGDNLLSELDSSVITVTGKDFATNYIPYTSAATFSTPAGFKTADTDYLWNSILAARNVTVGNLVDYDFNRTFVEFDSATPYNIRKIGILKLGETLTTDEINEVHKYFKLHLYWSNVLNSNGVIKTNRAFVKVGWTTEVGDANSFAWHDRNEPNGALRDGSGVESIYYDLITGKNQRGVEESSGVTLSYAVYEITATETDHFFVGCKVGDVFPASGGVIIDANNKVKRVLGNHLSQPTLVKKPTNGLFDGVDDEMKISDFIAIPQPFTVYLLIEQKSWTSEDYIFSSGLDIRQFTSSPQLRIFAGAGVNTSELTLNTLGLLSIVVNGTSSFVCYNNSNPSPVNLGASTLNKFIIANKEAALQNANIKFEFDHIRKVADSFATRTAFYNYLKTRYAI